MQLGQTPIVLPDSSVGLLPRSAYDEMDASFPVKAQYVRLLDVFLFGPVMIYGALTPQMNPAARFALAIIGAGTIIYNGANYLEIQRRQG